MPVLFLVVFVDLVGFGLLIPLLPFYVQRTGAGPEVITFVLGLYSLAQFIAAPMWGRLSDRLGRKPVLAVTCVGLAASYLVLAFADSLALVIASRVIGGFMAGNIAAAQAYVADVTAPDARAKGMGILGAAFGLGFIIGPAIGGAFAGAGVQTADYRSPALAAMVLSLAAALGVALLLKESMPREARTRLSSGTTWRDKLAAIRSRRALFLLAVAGFLVITGWAQFETTFALSVNALFAFGPRDIGFIFGFMGAVNVLVQGLFVGALSRRVGERRLAVASVILFILGYGLIAASPNPIVLILACTVLAAASALFNPSATSLVSQEAAPGERGAVMGAYQSATALGRVAGPAFAGTLFAAASALPYLAAAALAVPALVLVLLVRQPAK
ncbi:MAG: MFS transporter [Rhodospirillaceae bacterium]